MLLKEQVAQGLLMELSDYAQEYNRIYSSNPSAASALYHNMIGIAHFSARQLGILPNWELSLPKHPQRITRVSIQWNEQEIMKVISE